MFARGLLRTSAKLDKKPPPYGMRKTVFEPTFRFREAHWYRVADLRSARNEIRQACTENAAWGNRLRAPSGHINHWLKAWKEELLPLTELADHKGWSDDVRFCWTPTAPADFQINADGDTFGLQCTTAYPEWPNSVGQSPGHTRALELRRINRSGFAFGGGNPDTPTARDPGVDLLAWPSGIRTALKAKLDTKYVGLHLLICASQASFNLIDFVFCDALTPAVEAHAAEWRAIFQAVYVVDSRPGALIELVSSRPDDSA